MEPISGKPGELVGRLLEALADVSNKPERLINESVFLAVMLGGPLLEVRVVNPQAGTPKAGTVGEAHSWSHRSVDAAGWLDLVAERLLAFTTKGLSESLLIHGVLNEVSDIYTRMSDVGAATINRTEAREGLLADAEDPEQVARYQQFVANARPDEPPLHPDQAADQMRDMAERLFADPTADEATSHWADAEDWRRRCNAYLSDEDIETWKRRSVLYR